MEHIVRVVDPCKPLDIDLERPLEIEVGCGKGRFLTARAAAHPECDFLGIERMLERVRLFDGKCRRGKIDNAKVLRLEALYTFHYLLPAHHARRVYVFFPDPWPKKKHHSHRLFGPLFLNALWKRLEIGGRIEFATDHREYFETVLEGFAADSRFRRVDPMPRPQEVWTEFETMFREQGLPIYAAAWEALPAPDDELPPLTVPPEAEPREGVVRRTNCIFPLLLGAGVSLSLPTLTSEEVLEPSLVNEVAHAVARAPTNAPPEQALSAAARSAFAAKTNALSASAMAVRLVSEQRADGRWYAGTNEVTAAAVSVLKELLN